MLIPQDVRFLFECAKYCACFSKFLPVKRLKVILLKDRKSQILNIFRCQGVPKNRLYTETVSPLQSIPAFAPQLFLSLSLSYSDMIRIKMFSLKRWVFLEDIWSFRQWKSLITNEQYWMLWRAMIREVIILLPNR